MKDDVNVYDLPTEPGFTRLSLDDFPGLQRAVAKLTEVFRDDSPARRSDVAEVGAAVLEGVAALLNAHAKGIPVNVEIRLTRDEALAGDHTQDTES